MRAMVMAAGAGTRLRPLTFSVPKPMVPVANRPVLEYTLDNLKRHGITDLVLNLHSHPQMIRDHFKNGEKWGVRIEYSAEPQLLGTAGGVKKVSGFLEKDTFLVMSGDGLTAIDLSALISFHRRQRSVATMALKAVDTRFEYGVTVTDATGRINRFVEKPRWSDVFSNQVNTGIYVFEPSILGEIPSGSTYDFGHDLWPKLLRQNTPIYGHSTDAYWCDVGNLSEYRRAQRDVLDGKAGIQLPGKRIKPNVWVDQGSAIDRSVKIDPPVLIGKNCKIGAGSRIGAYTVIGNDAKIGKKTTLRNCILWDRVQVAGGVTLENCVIGHDARVSENISVYEGAIIRITE